jgi:FemAB-related protein (PEP-CTERM system-associated)
MIAVREWDDGAGAWDAFVESAPDGTIMHRHAWKDVIERAYGHRTFCLAAVDGDRIRGVLPLALIRSPLLPRRLVSLPFMDYGGICSAGDTDAEEALLSSALALAEAYRAALSLRQGAARPYRLSCSTEKMTVLLPLARAEAVQWQRLPSERRNRVRKAERAGLQASVHGPEALDAFYEVFGTNMRDLGSPVHSRAFFAEVMGALGPRARLVIVRSGDRPVGAGLMLRHGATVAMPWVSSLRSMFHLCPNQLLYWRVMQYAIAEGCEVLDLGRSTRGSTGLEAKRQWGGSPVALHWYYHPPVAGQPGRELDRLAWGVSMWQRLPLAVTNAIGPFFRRVIAN